MSEREICIECDASTGRAGRADDSLYHGDIGPFCEECFERLPEEWHDAAVGLRALLGRLIRNACPTNWSDDETSARAWLEAERLSGEPLPDEDYNGERRAELTRAANEET